MAAALILADKSDVRRSRVRNQDISKFDIHDRVNYSVTKAELKIDPRQRRDVSQLPARRVEPDARASFAERLRDFFRIFSDAGPDAHSGDDYSLLHGLRYISPR